MPNRTLTIFALIGLTCSLLIIFFIDYALAPKVLALGNGHETLWNFIIDIGDKKYLGAAMVIMFAVVFFLSRLRPEAAQWSQIWKKTLIVFAAFVGTGILVLILKAIVGRARPYGV